MLSSKPFRFSGDLDLFNSLISDKRIQNYIEGIEGDIQTTSDHILRNLYGHAFRIDSSSSPYLYEIIEGCASKLHLQDFKINSFINSSSEVNASCSRNGNDITLNFNAGLINKFDKPELEFVVGHELGHALFEHHKLPAYGICQSNTIGPSKLIKLMSWSRQAEISADRAGLICCGGLENATNALIKLSTGGIGPPVIEFDHDSFYNQIQEMTKIEIADKADEKYSTHPLNPLRVHSLIHFAESNYMDSQDIEDIQATDQKVYDLLELMYQTEKVDEKKKSSNKSTNDFILLCSYYVLAQDNDISKKSKDKAYKKELDSLYDMFEKTKVDKFLKDLPTSKTLDHLYQIIEIEAKYFKKKPKPQKCSAIEKIIAIARADGILSSEELLALKNICSLIGIKETFIHQVLKFLD